MGVYKVARVLEQPKIFCMSGVTFYTTRCSSSYISQSGTSQCLCVFVTAFFFIFDGRRFNVCTCFVFYIQ
uniref:Uncharacterized protein n=1 Tax=Anguilla anguilla TaxID=7936 RepID=A0A0E9T0Z6_ANGAN